MRTWAWIAALLAGAAAEAKVVTETVKYQDGDVELQGFLATDDASPGRRPAVLIVHEWWGLDDFAREKARAVAGLGYVAFAVDMYGGGRSTPDAGEAGKLAGQFRNDPEKWRARARAGLEALRRDPRVDPGRIAAIGFCFGGTTALHLAAAGEDLAGVVSFHGSLFPFSATDATRAKARILVLHGAADTHVPDAAVTAFQDALRKSRIDWQFVTYSGAKHSFTNPAADRRGMPGVGYDAAADRRSWAHMRMFLEELFQKEAENSAGASEKKEAR